MKLKHGVVLLLFIFIVREVTPRHTNYISELLRNLNISNKKNPLIIVVNAKKETENTNDSGNVDDLDIPVDGGNYVEYEYEARDEVKYMLYNYLLRTGEPQNTEEAIEENKRSALREALRSRCQARVECEKKCDKSEEKRKDKYCPVNCKAVFDRLNLCEPPKKEDKCKKNDTCEEEDSCKKNSCGKRGKTMPPKWRF